MSWYACPSRQRAYRVVRVVKSRPVVVLASQYGLDFEVALATLAEYGYHEVKNKPAYAEKEIAQ
jgi:hypothetical protein